MLDGTNILAFLPTLLIGAMQSSNLYARKFHNFQIYINDKERYQLIYTTQYLEAFALEADTQFEIHFEILVQNTENPHSLCFEDGHKGIESV